MTKNHAVPRSFLLAPTTPHGAAPSTQPFPLFPLLGDTDLEDLEDPTWLIDGILPLGSATSLVGPPASAKSFGALDASLRVATGTPWHGRQTQQGAVLYIAAEGLVGLKKRVQAWKRANKYLEVPEIFFLPMPVQLLDQSDIARLLATVSELDIEPKLIVFDTFARCFLGGDENSASTMGLAVEAVRQLQVATGATVLLVHHTRKGDNVERGSSALRGALDTIISARKDGPLVVLSCGKMKDAPDFDDVHLRLVEAYPSCVLELAVPATSGARLSSSERAVLDLLADEGMRHGDWRKAASCTRISSTSFDRARSALLDAGFVVKLTDGRYVPAAVVVDPDGTTSSRSFRTGTVEPGGSSAESNGDS
jgi:hypothetical protein